MSTNAAIYKKAHHALQPHRRQGAAYTAIWCIVLMILVMIGAIIQKLMLRRSIQPSSAYEGAISLYDIFPVVMIISAVIITVPLRNNTDRWLGMVTGVLTACDCGFLDCSSNIWLWSRRVGVTLFANLMLLCSFLPSIFLWSAGILCVRYGALLADSTVSLLTAFHFLAGGILLLMLPLRLWCSQAALPLCYLKQPHRSAYTLWRYALRCTKGIWGTLLCNRLKTLPMLMIPFYGYIALPKLLASEMLLCDRNRQHYLPDL